MWKCPVCDKENTAATVCPTCGFDGSCDYEHYPTAFAVAGAKSTRALRREWEQKQGPGLDQLLWNWFVKTQEQPGDSTSAEACFRRLADSGNREAQLWLAGCYEYGVGAAKDLALAMDWYRKAAEQGSIPAQKRLAELDYQESIQIKSGKNEEYLKGTNPENDALTAKEWYEKYLNEEDQERAAAYLTRAADMGYAEAQYSLGLCHACGAGVSWDNAAAAKCYLEAANQNHPKAQFELGKCYAEGLGVQMDCGQAAEWYRKAAKQDYAEAQYSLGVCYERGIGVPKDPAQASDWYRKAAKQGHIQAQEALHRRYAEEQDLSVYWIEAVNRFRIEASQGNAGAQFSLGECYSKGRGVVKDLAQAADWYRKAAKQDYAAAQYRLGECYANGYGVAINELMAAKWYRKAAKQGHKGAVEALRKMAKRSLFS